MEGPSVLEIIGWWEFALAVGVLLLAGAEVVGLVLARRAGLTSNVSRLLTHGALAAHAAVYAWLAVWWSGSFHDSVEGVVGIRFGIANWGFLLLAGMLALVLYELVAQIWATHMGYSQSVSRVVTHVAMATIVALLFMMNLTRWQIYRSGVLEGRPEADPTGSMLQIVGRWELVLVLGVVLLAAAEFVGLAAARRAGRTENFSRLVIYSALAVLAAIYAWIEALWARGLVGADSLTVGSHPASAEWGLVVLVGMLFLALYAVATLAWARQFGLTSTIRRLVTHLVLAAFVILIVAINLTRWQIYFGILEEGYEESIRPISRSE